MIFPGQFLLNFKNDCASTLFHGTPSQNKFDIYGSYPFHHQPPRQQQPQRVPSPAMDGEVLDLSRHCDSVETRKTPSPNNSTSSFGTASPSTRCGSSPNSTATPAIIPRPIVPNKFLITQNTPPPLPPGIPSLHLLSYANTKNQVTSPQPSVPAAPVIANPLPIFPHSQVGILQQTIHRNTNPAPYTSPKLEEQKCSSPPSLAIDPKTILYPNILNAATTGTINYSKATRPFNAYPRDPTLVNAHFNASDRIWEKKNVEYMEDYSTFRKRTLNDLRDTNGGHRIVTNPKMRRTNIRSGKSNSECEERAMESSDNDSSNDNAEPSNKNDTNNNNDCHDSFFNGGRKDEAYYERRRKNNAAAKKSRDRRRIKEDEIAIRAAYLERQNIELLCQIDALKKQLQIFAKA